MSKNPRRIRDRRLAKLRVEHLEDRTVPASISGFVYLDVDGDGAFDTGDLGIQDAVVSLGAIISDPSTGTGTGYTALSTTDANGAYRFDVGGGANSVYTVSEAQPTGYKQGTNTLGNGTGTLNGDTFEGIRLSPTQDATGYNFGELAPYTVNNNPVYNNTNNNTNTNNNGGTNNNVNNDANDQSQSQNQGQNQNQNQNQSQGQTNTNSGSGQYQNDDCDSTPPTPPLPPAPLPPAPTPTPPPLAGYVYLDTNGDGSREGDPGFPGVPVLLIGAGPDGRLDTIDDTQVVTATADDGSYSFGNALPPGLYRLAEEPPVGGPYAFVEPTALVVAYPAAGLAEQNFRAVPAAAPLPPLPPAPLPPAVNHLSGTVYEDRNGNGAFDAGDVGIPNVFVLIDSETTYADGTVAGVSDDGATTDGTGAYHLDLPTSDGAVETTYTVTEFQPAGYTDGTNTLGNANGTVTPLGFQVTLTPGQDAAGYNFGEVAAPQPPLSPAPLPPADPAPAVPALPPAPCESAPGPRFRYEPSWRGGVFVCSGDFDDAARPDQVVKHHRIGYRKSWG